MMTTPLILLAAVVHAAPAAAPKPDAKALEQLRGIVAELEKPPVIDPRGLAPAKEGAPAARRLPGRRKFELTLDQLGVDTGNVKVGVSPKDGGPRVDVRIPF